ncbi:MAG: hypothetical protein ABIR70_17770 [Bryobacteraceae bacterium]
MSSRTKRFFGDEDKKELLTALRLCRMSLQRVSTIAPIGGDVYQGCDAVRKAIDELGFVLTGDREHFYAPRHIASG